MADSEPAPLTPLIAVLSLGAVMTIFDTTVVNVGLDTLGRDLRLSITEAQWVGAAYLLALAFGVPSTGWFTDRFGTKRVWIGALAVFLGGSALCGAAWSPGSLIAFRAVQGFGGGMVMPVGQAILVRRVGRPNLGRYMGVLSMPLLLGPSLGPIIGGLVADRLDWRWIFFINLPLGVPTLVLAARLLRDDAGVPGQRLDVRGLMLLPPGLVAVVYGLSRLGDGGAVLPAAAGLAVGAALVVAFALHARGLGRAALIDVGLFGRVEFRAASVIAFFFGLLMFGGFFLLPLYYQVVRGASALEAGLLMAPQGLGSLVALPVAGWLADRFGAGRVVPVGLAVAAVATVPFVLADGTTSYAALAVAQFARGIGMSSVMTPAYAAAYAALDPPAVPRATAAVNVINRIGGSVGAAVLAVILAQAIGDLVPASEGRHGLAALGAISPSARAALAPQLAHAFGYGYAVLLGCTLAAFVPAAFLPRAARKRSSSPASAGPAP